MSDKAKALTKPLTVAKYKPCGQQRSMTMGSGANAAIAAWQQNAGIEPASGVRAEILEALSKAAFEAIKIIEIERSGIRDGDGYWHGSDVIGHMTADLIELCHRLNSFDKEQDAQVLE
jgi:hypothetical protein